MSASGREYSTLGVRKDTKRRFDDAKPYDSLSADEFIEELLDAWGGRE